MNDYSDFLFRDASETARIYANNHARFESFGWHGAPDDKNDYAIIYISSRDADFLTQSNAQAIVHEMQKHRKNAWTESHSHWGDGWVVGLVIRVYKNGRVTKAWKSFHSIGEQLGEHPVLDEEHWAELEWDYVYGLILEHDDFDEDKMNREDIADALEEISEHTAWKNIGDAIRKLYE